MAKHGFSKKAAALPMGISIICAIVVICMLAAPVVYLGEGDSATYFSGAQTAFGYSETVLGLSVQILSANSTALFALLILPIVGVVLAVLGYKLRIVSLASGVAFIVAAVFSFVMVTTFPSTVIGSQYATLTAQTAVGASVAFAFNFIAGLAQVAKWFYKKIQ